MCPGSPDVLRRPPRVPQRPPGTHNLSVEACHISRSSAATSPCVVLCYVVLCWVVLRDVLHCCVLCSVCHVVSCILCVVLRCVFHVLHIASVVYVCICDGLCYILCVTRCVMYVLCVMGYVGQSKRQR